MSAIAPATTTTIAYLERSNDGPFYEAQLSAGAWTVRMPGVDGDLANALVALDAVPSLNLVAMPGLATLSGDAYRQAIAAIAVYCASRRAFFIVEPPADWIDVDSAARGVQDVAPLVRENGAIYWPLLTSGSVSRAVAAVYVVTDVWKAPAGVQAAIPGADPAYKLSEAETGALAPLGVNCIRSFPVYGTVIWGTRTLAGADALASDFKYVSVRRLTLFIESSIIDGLQWTVTLPNAIPLWSQIRQSVTAFMGSLWSAGAFAGATMKDAFFVQCDSSTTTQEDIDAGIVNVVVGFAPVTPAEFVVVSLQAQALSPLE